MPFQKGQSGNPGGRPKGVAAYLKEKYGDSGEKLIARLEKLSASSKAEKIKLAATIELLNRGWGKPAQVVELGDPDGRPMIAFTINLNGDDPA